MKLRCCLIAVILFFTFYNSLFAQNKEDSVIVLPIKMSVPANAVIKGSIKMGNNSTDTHCDYEKIIAKAKEKAMQMGGNVVKITRLIPPAFIGKCYRINADIYYADKLPDSLYKVIKSINNETPATQNYAMVYIYRLPDTIMLASSYSIHLNNDSVICTIKSRSKDSVKIYKEGPQVLWAKTEERVELKLDVKFGAVYYIRCGLKGGQLRNIPVIELIDNKTGTAEIEKSKRSKKDQSVKYLQEMH